MCLKEEKFAIRKKKNEDGRYRKMKRVLKLRSDISLVSVQLHGAFVFTLQERIAHPLTEMFQSSSVSLLSAATTSGNCLVWIWEEDCGSSVKTDS